MSNLIGTTVMCPECGAWNVPGHSCRDKNPFQDIANALARAVRETDALKCRLTVASTLERQLAAKVTGLEAALGVEKGEKTRYRDALVCIQVFSKTQIECLDQSDTEEDNTERANAVWINEKVNAVLGGW